MKNFMEILGECVLVENMQPSEILSDMKKAEEFIGKSLEKIFPKQYVSSRFDDSLTPTLSVDVISVPKNSSLLDRKNAKGKVSFLMIPGDGGGNLFPRNDFFFEPSLYGLRDINGVKIRYRKSVSKTPMDAAKKLVSWYKKNKEKMIMTSI